MNFIYILGTVFFTVYGLLAIKSQMILIKVLPESLLMKFIFLTKMVFTNFWVFSGIASAFLASLCWMVAMTKFDLSFAYPFTGLNFVLILICSYLLFGEPLSLAKISGALLICLGIFISSR